MRSSHIDDELILEDDLIEYRAIVKSFRVGLHVDRVNLSTLKVVVEEKKKLLERQKGKRYLMTPKIPRVSQ